MRSGAAAEVLPVGRFDRHRVLQRPHVDHFGRRSREATAVEFADGVPIKTGVGQGDGTVPDACAILTGVTDVARAAKASHTTLPLNRQVMQSVWRMIEADLAAQAMAPDTPRTTGASETKGPEVTNLPAPRDLLQLAGVVNPKVHAAPAVGSKRPVTPYVFETPAAPSTRRLRGFSYDPLLAGDPEAMGTESLVLHLDWDDESADGSKLLPGPIGEYSEVVDCDPSSGSFYAPVDERPDLPPEKRGKLVPGPNGEYVRRLRPYPHAMRDANAYYDPRRKAVLFGYFPARSKPGGKVLPNGPARRHFPDRATPPRVSGHPTVRHVRGSALRAPGIPPGDARNPDREHVPAESEHPAMGQNLQ